MSKVIVFGLLIAMTGCAEASGDVSLIGASYARAGGAADVTSAPVHAKTLDVATRDPSPPRFHHRDAEFVVCAQCRR